MANFKEWCVLTKNDVNNHQLRTLLPEIDKLHLGIDSLAKTIPGHYASEERLAALFKRLGKEKVSEFIIEKLPTQKNIRSGDLGEILGSAYLNEYTKYKTGINKLRWKDHRNMAMRGADLLAVRGHDVLKIKFIKGEVKSRKALSLGVMNEAYNALGKDNNRPSAHSLAFLADRLYEEGNDELASLIDDALLTYQIKDTQISHLIFTFSGNEPTKILNLALSNYKGSVSQYSVGLHISEHQEFIKAVYEKVFVDGC